MAKKQAPPPVAEVAPAVFHERMKMKHTFRCTTSLSEWMERVCNQEEITLSSLIGLAMRSYAKEKGLALPPPRIPVRRRRRRGQ